jgi:hypothetical protein
MRLSLLLAAACLLEVMRTDAAPTDPVLGFGEKSRGGAGGRVLMVTRRDDNPQHPTPGSLRWALKQRGPRVVKFAVAGDIQLEDRIIVREPFLTVDGSDAPGDGVCIRKGSLMFRGTHDVIVMQVRIRLGESPAQRQRRENHSRRPPHSAGLDCVSLDDSRRIVFDHCSLSWSCDEIFGITHCQEVTLQWCLLSSPLANRRLHPYGDRHAFPINASASTLSVHHCLMAHYVMRGPQFEANDLRPEDRYTVRMEAVNNVMFDYERSGSRYGSGVEKDNGTAAGKKFQFEFLNNFYLTNSFDKLPLEAITKHGVIRNVQVHASGNVWEIVNRDRIVQTQMVRAPFWSEEKNSPRSRGQVSAARLFSTSASERPESIQTTVEPILRTAGCSRRDAVDQQVIDDVRRMRFGKIAHHEPGIFRWLGL